MKQAVLLIGTLCALLAVCPAQEERKKTAIVGDGAISLHDTKDADMGFGLRIKFRQTLNELWNVDVRIAGMTGYTADRRWGDDEEYHLVSVEAALVMQPAREGEPTGLRAVPYVGGGVGGYLAWGEEAGLVPALGYLGIAGIDFISSDARTVFVEITYTDFELEDDDLSGLGVNVGLRLLTY